mmetsp:Transcript_50651/g.128881  ORF Transcript_50651/g.128881 Transcript_50651/m.128881 type:complete len:134 (+) Transcript_50651:136-537(+)
MVHRRSAAALARRWWHYNVEVLKCQVTNGKNNIPIAEADFTADYNTDEAKNSFENYCFTEHNTLLEEKLNDQDKDLRDMRAEFSSLLDAVLHSTRRVEQMSGMISSLVDRVGMLEDRAEVLEQERRSVFSSLA